MLSEAIIVAASRSPVSHPLRKPLALLHVQVITEASGFITEKYMYGVTPAFTRFVSRSSELVQLYNPHYENWGFGIIEGWSGILDFHGGGGGGGGSMYDVHSIA